MFGQLVFQAVIHWLVGQSVLEAKSSYFSHASSYRENVASARRVVSNITTSVTESVVQSVCQFIRHSMDMSVSLSVH